MSEETQSDVVDESVVSEETVQVEEPVVVEEVKEASKKVTKKKASKPAAKAPPEAKKTVKSVKTKTESKVQSKKEVKKTAPVKAASGPKAHGIDRDHDLPWNEKKVAVFKALKTLKAFDSMQAKSAKEIAEKSNGVLNDMDVRHYCYHGKAGGLIGVHQMEGVRGYSFSLTKKGQTINPVEELNKRRSS